MSKLDLVFITVATVDAVMLSTVIYDAVRLLTCIIMSSRYDVGDAAVLTVFVYY